MAHGHEYPIYSGEPTDRGKVRMTLALTAFLIFVAYDLVENRIRLGNWDWVRFWGEYNFITASLPLLIFGILSRLFDEWIWKTRVGGFLFYLLQIPQPQDLSGRYRVRVTWFDRDAAKKGVGNSVANATASGVSDSIANADERATGESDAIATIKQDWRTLIVDFSFPDELGRRAWSMSRMALLEEGPNRSYVNLIYTYEYEGLEIREDRQGLNKKRIKGTARLTFLRNANEWKIDGDYYSDDASSGRITSIADDIVLAPRPGLSPSPTADSPPSMDQ